MTLFAPHRTLRMLTLIALLITLITSITGTASARSTSAEPQLPSTINTPGICDNSDGGNTSQKYVDRYSSYIGDAYFDRVSGTARSDELAVCIGISIDPPGNCPGGTWVLPANVSGTNGNLIQVGWGRCAGEQENHFVWTIDGHPHFALDIVGNKIQAAFGRTYRTTIYRRSTGKISFDIYDVDADYFIWTYYPTTTWSTNNNRAFWMYEIYDTGSDASELGHTHGDPDWIKMHDMIYQGNNDNVDHWRQPSASEVFCAGYGCNPNVHAHLSTTTYASDTFDVDTVDH